jgi:uncharacterized membrane protein YesL
LTRLWQFSSKEGPGIPKDAAPKSGFALLCDVLARQWWELIQLNLLVILFSLPLVTIPAALVAATRVCVLMLEDRNVYLGRDFLEAFRQRFWRATALGGAAATVIGLAAYAGFTFLHEARENIFLALPLTVSAATAVFALIAACYALTLLAMRDQKLVPLLQRALLGALARPLPALVALAFVAMLWLLHILFYPVSLFMPAIINFSFGTLAVTFGVHKAAARLLVLDKSTEAGAAYAGGSANAR